MKTYSLTVKKQKYLHDAFYKPVTLNVYSLNSLCLTTYLYCLIFNLTLDLIFKVADFNGIKKN